MKRAAFNRAVSVGIALGFVVASHAVLQDPLERSGWQYRWVTAIGYGHLLGAAVFGWRRAARRRARVTTAGGAPALACAAGLVGLATLFVLYGSLVSRFAWLVAPMLAVSVWHIVENDRALGAIYAHPDLGRAELSPAVGDRLRDGAASLAILLLAGATLDPDAARELIPGAPMLPLPSLGSLAPWLGFSDVFSTVTAYHLASWLLLSVDRLARLARAEVPSARRRARRDGAWLAGVHALPAGAVALLALSADPRAESLGRVVFSPGIYLFWSVAHVVQTAAARGVAPRPVPARAAQA